MRGLNDCLPYEKTDQFVIIKKTRLKNYVLTNENILCFTFH